MKKLLSPTGNQDIVFVNNVKELKKFKSLANKKLCIIKTDFRDLDYIKEICKTYPSLEVWVASNDISRQNILNAGMCGIKNIIQYPLKREVINDLIKNKSCKNNQKCDGKIYDSLTGLKVMLVDDNPFNNELLEETLKPLNLNFTSCKNPAEAANIIKNEKFDLFILDIMMPELSGFELAQIIQNTSQNAGRPIIFISALSDIEHKIESYNLGSYIYIEKPFNINAVKSQICSLLKACNDREKFAKQQNSYLAMVTHDLKGPVQAEISALDVLLAKYNKNLDQNQVEILEGMRSSSKFLQNLVTNILQKYQSDNDKIILNKQLHSFKKLINECCEEVKYCASERNLTIDASYKTDQDEIWFDYNEIKRVIHNILTNALKYSYKNRSIYLEITSDNNNIIVSVKNYGFGVELDNPDDVFNKFTSYCEKNKCVNSGLGLYISKKIIDAHKGSISFKSIPDDYTCVTFTLPLRA